MSTKNRRIVLASRPSGEPGPENFRLEEMEVPEAGPGQVLLRTVYLSLDPYMRGRMSDSPSYAAPVAVGEVMVGFGICKVAGSNDLVVAGCGWQEYSVSDARAVQRIDPGLKPVTYALGVLGGPGLTAYTGLLNIGKPQAGETLVVAAASGAVGSVVGQIGKILGCRVIGIAGRAEKCRYVKEELRFDECLDRRAPDLAGRLREACPKGIDVYFENVGGAVFDAVMPLLNNFARIPVCGLIAGYNASSLPGGPDRSPLLMRNILTKRWTFRGFIVSDFWSQFGDFARDVGGWVREGRIRYREDITDGLENAPRELIGLLKGENFGKKIIRVS
jgi:NADPH-dependent curcumin reductase CurA